MSKARPLLLYGALLACAAVWWMAGLYLYLSPNLPEESALRNITLRTPMRVLSRDGALIGQFGEQKRKPLQFEQIPQNFIDALLAAEDDGFFEHSGIEPLSLLRAVSELVLTGRKGSGGSTLTMQVARNYFLTLDQTFLRKFTEILLALEIEARLTKEDIFELYVNRVFLGHRAYGFEAAAETYYGKPLSELNLAQHAMLAGVPKAPSRNNPLSSPEKGKVRRDWILGRMANLGMIDERERLIAQNAPVTAAFYGQVVEVDADYVAEMVRQEMVERFGNGAYNDGYVVYTTVEADLQQAAHDALLQGLRTYDWRHGWRGPERRLPPREDETSEQTRARWEQALRDMPTIAKLPPAIVTSVSESGVTTLSKTGESIFLSWEGDLSRVRGYRSVNQTAAPVGQPDELLAPGDMIRIRESEEGWRLAQVPKAQSALVSLDPKHGAIRALVGGMGFELSKFNRATQAKRQPGSNFKPFLYASALRAGITPSTVINDAPVVLDNLAAAEIWRPENDSGKFYGPTRLREALAFSRNLVSIRVLQRVGVRAFIRYVEALGFDTEGIQANLTLALGTHTFTPLEIATGYAILANEGFKVEPWLIERIENASGEIVYAADPLVACPDCANTDSDATEEVRMEDILGTAVPEVRAAERVMDPRVAFIISSFLNDAIQRGTGRRARVLERQDISGKTGTTNGPRDAWFSGFNRDLITTAWVGFDDYGPLGRREFGGTAALPIWIDYMREALPAAQPLPPMPPGIVRVRVDRESGLRVRGQPNGSIMEYFLEESLPDWQSDAGSRFNPDYLDQIF
ncbi:MAG: penicillin-binding protein 1A [Luminiphilus sp.]